MLRRQGRNIYEIRHYQRERNKNDTPSNTHKMFNFRQVYFLYHCIEAVGLSSKQSDLCDCTRYQDQTPSKSNNSTMLLNPYMRHESLVTPLRHLNSCQQPQ
jgi:hypothetical protein